MLDTTGRFRIRVTARRITVTEAKKPKRGRPPVFDQMPERINASPEEVVEAVLRIPLKTDWRYLKGRKSLR